VYRLHRTSRNAGTAIDADIRIDIAALAVGVEALHRAMFDAVRKQAKAAIVRDDVGHDRLQSWGLNS
jgi:polysaccharide pyruvyl transferase WcaK-like protein